MKAFVRFALLGTAVAGLVGASPAIASTDYFSLTDTATSTVYTFTLDSTPIPSSVDSATGIAVFDAVPFAINGVSQTPGYIGFFEAADGGSIAIQDAAQSVLEGPYGAQIFTNTLDAPVIVPGTYAQFSDFAETNQIGTLVISSATPEPASFVLLGTGVLGMARVVRRRFAR